MAILALAFITIPTISCQPVKEYQKNKLNDSEMILSNRKAEKTELSFQSYREGASGAVFTVRLPLPAAIAETPALASRPGLSAAEAPWSAPSPSLAGVRIVAVDDEPDARELLRAVFAQSGATVFLAASAREAVALLVKERPDVLVADVGMPGEDGYTLIARIRTLPADEGGNTPALALTAFARGEDRAQALRSGFDVHVPKPVEPVELIIAVRDLVDRKR